MLQPASAASASATPTALDVQDFQLFGMLLGLAFAAGCVLALIRMSRAARQPVLQGEYVLSPALFYEEFDDVLL